MDAVLTKRGLSRALALAASLLAALLLGMPARAQVSNQYSNATGGAITDISCGTASALTRTFTVPTGYAITDVNIGIALLQDHPDTVTWGGFVHNLVPVTAGNVVGGALFVGGAYWLGNAKLQLPGFAKEPGTGSLELPHGAMPSPSE